MWIIPQQLYDYGNTWRFSTCGIESRGARLKRIGRKVVNWRPYAATRTEYNFKNRKTDEQGQTSQNYESSPMLQLMSRMAYTESTWEDASSVFVRPEKWRLRQQLRSCKLKCELADDVSVDEAASMVEALRSKADASASN